MSGAVTATVAVIGAMTVAETFAAIAVVGAVVSVAGMVTKSKELQIAGTVLGAVGGIGSLAVSAGIGGLSAGMTLGEVGGFGPAAAGTVATDAASWGVSAASGAADMTAAGTVATDAASWGVSAASGAAGATPAGMPADVISMTNGFPNPNAITTSPPPDVGGAVNAMPATGSPATASAAPTDVTAPVQPAAGGTPAGGQVAAVTPGATPPGALPPASPPPAPAVTPTTAPTVEQMVSYSPGVNGAGAAGGSITKVSSSAAPGTWEWLKEWAMKGNAGPAYLAAGVLKAGADLVTGSLSPLPDAQVAALKAQAAQNLSASNLYNQQAALSAQQQANMAAPIPVASRTAPPGLINQPRPVYANGATT